jgi:hypothetical protein
MKHTPLTAFTSGSNLARVHHRKNTTSATARRYPLQRTHSSTPSSTSFQLKYRPASLYALNGPNGSVRASVSHCIDQSLNQALTLVFGALAWLLVGNGLGLGRFDGPGPCKA